MGSPAIWIEDVKVCGDNEGKTEAVTMLGETSR